MKIVCVANFPVGAMDFGRFIDLLSPNSGVLRRDFPESWDSRQNLAWYREDPKYVDGEEIKRRAAHQWGETLVRDQPCVIVDFQIPVGHVGRVGFFELATGITSRKMMRFNPVRFSWSVHSGQDFSNKRGAVLEDIKHLPWYQSTRFIEPSSLTDNFKHVEIDEGGLAFLVELYEEHEVRTIEASVGQIFVKHGLTFSQIAPATCPTCKGVIQMERRECLACAEKERLERKAREAAEWEKKRIARETTERERKRRRECTMCGRRLGFLDILRRHEKHHGCTSFVPDENQKAP